MSERIVHLVAAARPNFMKVAPLWHALQAAPDFRPVLVHSGQHYDVNMSDAFFSDLRLPEPDFHLGVGSGSHAEQTGGVMIAYEKVALADRPDWIIVVGDVNSTAACAMVAGKLGIPAVHLEAGLRSRDRAMPEELNRLVTDVLADVLWTPSPDADENLRREAREAYAKTGKIKRRVDERPDKDPITDDHRLAREIVEREAASVGFKRVLAKDLGDDHYVVIVAPA